MSGENNVVEQINNENSEKSNGGFQTNVEGNNSANTLSPSFSNFFQNTFFSKCDKFEEFAVSKKYIPNNTFRTKGSTAFSSASVNHVDNIDDGKGDINCSNVI